MLSTEMEMMPTTNLKRNNCPPREGRRYHMKNEKIWLLVSQRVRIREGMLSHEEHCREWREFGEKYLICQHSIRTWIITWPFPFFLLNLLLTRQPLATCGCWVLLMWLVWTERYIVKMNIKSQSLALAINRKYLLRISCWLYIQIIIIWIYWTKYIVIWN